MSLPLDDRGLLLGDGLFETLLVIDGAPVWWAAHMARLRRGCAALSLPEPAEDDALAAARQVLTTAEAPPRAALRLTWTAGSGGRGLDRPAILSPRLLSSLAPAPRPTAPLRLASVSVRRNAGSPASRHKTLAYLDNVLARREARAAGADEAVMLNTDGHVACAAAGKGRMPRRDARSAYRAGPVSCSPCGPGNTRGNCSRAGSRATAAAPARSAEDRHDRPHPR